MLWRANRDFIEASARFFPPRRDAPADAERPGSTGRPAEGRRQLTGPSDPRRSNQRPLRKYMTSPSLTT